MPEKAATPKAERAVRRRGKKVRKGRKHSTAKAHKFYEVKGDKVTRKKKPCPRCGTGTWLAEHKNRVYCGRCSYTEFSKSE